MDILDLLDEPKLLGKFFRSDTWHNWRIFLAAAFNLPHRLTSSDLAVFRLATGRSTIPTLVTEIFCCCGRRAGKSQIAAVIAIFFAFIKQYPNRAVGEVITVPIVAATRSQARTILRYVRGFIDAVPHFRKLVVRDTGEMIELSNGATIEILVGSSRSIRGYTFGCALCDEIAFWEVGENFADPDDAILEAMRPSLATIEGSLLVCRSSPYARRGELWSAYQKHFGNDASSVLFWKAASKCRSGGSGVEMNLSLPQRTVDAAFEADERAAAADFHAEFRRDVESIVTLETINANVVRGRTQLLPAQSVRYVAFCDPSGGSSDSFTAAIAHAAGNRVVLDCLLEFVPPFSPDVVVEDICRKLAEYRLTSICGDRFGGEWVKE